MPMLGDVKRGRDINKRITELEEKIGQLETEEMG